MRWRARLTLFAAALWWGSLTAVVGLAAPVLWRTLPVAGLVRPVMLRLLEVESWLAIACGLFVLVAFRSRMAGPGHEGALAMIAAAALGMLSALLLQFSVVPRVLAAPEALAWWGAGTVLLLLQWLCAAALLWRAASLPGQGPTL